MHKSTLAGAAMIAAAAIAVPVIAWSQTPPQAPAAAPDHPGPGMMQMMHHHDWGRWANQSPQQACQDRIAHRAGFVAYIGAKLNLTADQKPLWEKLLTATQAAQDNEMKTCATLPASADARDKETIIDKMTHRQAIMQAHLQGLQQTMPAVQALYQVLTPEQKAIVDHPFHRG